MHRSFTRTLLAAALAVPATGAFASDHLEAPGVAGNGQIDIADLYAFQSPANADNTVLILTVNPGAGALSPTTFGTNVSYDILVDNDGDAVPDVSFVTLFADTADGQSFTTTRTEGDSTTTVISGATGGSIVNGDTQISTGLFDDPFFFDFDGFNDGLNFTGEDFFAGLDVSAIVLEIPSSELGADNVGLYARTVVDGVQLDRVGRPAIATVLIPDGTEDAFNAGEPVDDFDVFGDDVNAIIVSLSDQENADALTPVLLPDLLTFDASDPSGFLNGRGLADDVIDAELALLSAGALTTDGVDSNDAAFLDVFPFLAAANGVAPADPTTPNVVPTPSAAVAGLAMLGMVARRRRRA